MPVISTGYITDVVNGMSINSSKKCHSANYNNNTSRDIKYIVMHYTGNAQKDTASNNANYFATGSRSASAHFFVDDTSIYQSVELRDTAWHCGCSSGYKTSCRNANSIGIEMCCTAGNYKISETTQINAAYLCAEMCKKVGINASAVDTYVLRHYDVVKTNKKCPAQFVDDPSQWTRFKTWVKNILNTGSHTGTTSTSASGQLYRVRKSWNDASSQIGAFSSLENAKAVCKDGYYVFDSNGNVVYPVSSSTSTSSNGLYRVRKTWADASSQLGAFTSLDNAKAACKDGYSVFDSNGNVVYTKSSSSSSSSSSISNSSSTDTKELIKIGQQHAVNFTGVKIAIDGIVGSDTKEMKIRVLQRAMNLDYGNTITEDGIWGTKTQNKLGSHYVAKGEKQYMVTAAEILMYLNGIDPAGLELPGIYGSGLVNAAKKKFGGSGTRISASNFMTLAR